MNLLWRGEILLARVIKRADFCGRDEEITRDVLEAHRLDNNLVAFRLAELRHRVTLRLQRADECLPVAAEFTAYDFLDPTIDDVLRDRKILLFELLEDQLAVDEILQRALAGVTHLVDQFLAGICASQ